MKVSKSNNFKHIFKAGNYKTKKVIFTDSFIKIRYYFDKYYQILRLYINVKKKVPYLIKENYLFLIQAETEEITLVYTDKYIRVFRSNKNNYLITVL